MTILSPGERVRERVQKFGFTLAEVLITLGIIGVVAALTIPTLVNKYQEQQFTQQLKKMYSIITNAEKLSVIDNGSVKYWENDNVKGGNSPYGVEFYNKYYAPYIKGQVNTTERLKYTIYNLNGEESKLYEDMGVAHYSDGSCMTFLTNNHYDWWVYDTNCSKKPNIIGRDIWPMVELHYFWNMACQNHNKLCNTRMIIPTYPNSGPGYCRSYQSSGGSQSNCMELFVKNGWKFSDDFRK